MRTSKQKSMVLLLFIIFSIGFVSCQTSDTRKITNNSIHLTPEDKASDMAYLFNFINESYPFVETIAQDKGLGDILTLKHQYIEKAKTSKNNEEFIKTIDEIILILRQGTRHANIMEGQDLPTDFDTVKHCFYNDITPNSIKYHKYWWNKLNYQSRFSNTDIDIVYSNGNYMLSSSYRISGISLPQGTVINRIDGVSALEYIKSLKTQILLRYDPTLKIPYSNHPSPFCTYGDKYKDYWEVEFLLENGITKTYDIRKKMGFKPARQYPTPNKNLICRELSSNVAYIGVLSFPNVINSSQDIEEIQKFIDASNNKFDKLIIDLRGNMGGSVAYGQEVLINPFISKDTIHIQYAAVKKIVFDKIYNKMIVIDSLETNTVRQYAFGQIEKIDYNELPLYIKTQNRKDNNCYYIKTLKNYSPKNNINFRGEIYLLIDNDCFSATETVIRAYKHLGIGKVLGSNSGGGSAVVLPLWIFELPKSHILFMLEVELTFNDDGSINELYGTKPDIELEKSTYPTAFPISYSKTDLLSDDWIKKIINEK